MQINQSELLIGMLAVLAVVALLAEKIRIAHPILLVFAGGLMGVIPAFYKGLPELKISPELVFFIFLPPLLYYAGILTTWRDFKANLRPISELAVGLVAVTMIAVACAAKYTIADMTWPVAFVLGAIVSPPDAIAATAILGKLSVPRRVVTILEGESLVNDATALVAYRIALGMIGSTVAFSVAGALWQITFVSVGGIAVGLAISYLAAKLMEKVDVPGVATVLALLVPYAAYIPAEKLQVSGVLAAVAAGIVMGRKLPSLGSPQYRIRTLAVWQSLVFLLEGLVFILIGMQLYEICMSVDWRTLLPATLVIIIVAILVRILWVVTAASIPSWVPVIGVKAKTEWRRVLVVSWAGMRGIVTLASALALPNNFPLRHELLFISFGVIFATLVFQGLSLAPLIKFLKIKDNENEEHREEVQARLDAAHAAVSRLTVLSFEDSISPDIINRVRAEYDERILRLGGKPPEEIDCSILGPDEMLRTVQREALIAERKMITFMRDQNILGDEILRRILIEIDLEEAKLTD